MKGEPIESVKVGLSDMIASLRLDPYALETACISIITYDKDVKQILPLTELEKLQLPDIECPESGPTHTGAALNMLRVLTGRDLSLSKGCMCICRRMSKQRIM